MALHEMNRLVLLAVAVLCLAGFATLIVGIVKQNSTENCSASSASQRVSSPHLIEFIKKVQKAYYKMNPNKIIFMPDATIANTRQEFSAYDAMPSAIKRRTDMAKQLYAEISNMKLNEKTMLLRERKALAQVKHYLQSNFGAPYDENYYAGDWMMGPNYFCWQPICYIGSDLFYHFTANPKYKGFQPKNLSDMEFVIDAIKKHGKSVSQYVENMKYGVKAGMVRSVKDCESGLNSISSRFPIIARNNETGTVYCVNFFFSLSRDCTCP